MHTKIKDKHFITTQDWSVQELKTLFEMTKQLKLELAAGKFNRLLEGKTLGMIFFDASTRTRTSFEAAMTQLGGHGIYFAPEMMQISHGEGAKEFLNEFGVEIAHLATRYLRLEHEKGTAAHIDGDFGQGLVHGDDSVAEAREALRVLERLLQGLAEAYADVLDGMVCIHLEVALGLHR